MSPIFTLSLLLAIAAVHSSKYNCGPNAIFEECGNSRDCHKTCDKLDNSRCINQMLCRPTCECIEGYVRDRKSDRCVLPHQCPRKVPQQPNNQYQCGPNAIFEECGYSSDCHRTCDKLDTSRCISDMMCYPGCVCREGYVRDRKFNRCILPHQCPRRNMPVYNV
ncbi:zonadhesin-like [Leptopilina boulardi]|uniref:zonadhesin-like n=1 Tax=Leptopilina boulardi TaxID=63433 RepID=UPI0021F63FD7|nr:zonadhesin-like [Leptopilina boulardi]